TLKFYEGRDILRGRGQHRGVRAAVAGQSLPAVEQDVLGELLPGLVRGVEIPKDGGAGVRLLGVPTVADRIAQTVVAMELEKRVEPKFYPDSYGYRPKRSALDAVGTCRRRCWEYDWVVDLDIQKFFDSVDHSLMVKAVEANTGQPWVVLYVKRWLAAPTQYPDGSLHERDRGTPQGSAVSPVLANLSSITHSTPGWRGTSQLSGSSGMWMMRWSTVWT